MKPKIYNDAEPKKEAAVRLGSLLSDNQKHSVLLLLSGGSWIEVLNEVPLPKNTEHIVLTTADERFSQDPEINNFLQIAGTSFYNNMRNAGASEISTAPEEYEGSRELQSRYETALRGWFAENEDGVVIAALGVGKDGHIGGNFAGCLSDGDWTHPCTLPPEAHIHRERVTTTLSFLRKRVTHTVVYAVGSEKCTALKAALTDADTEEIPAAVLRDMHDVHVYTDCIL